jgi:hypothetical protein
VPEPDRLPDRPPRRHELEAPYRHPYRLAAAEAWRSTPALRGQAKLAGALVVTGTAGALTLEPLLVMLVAVGLLLGLFDLLALGTWTLSGALQRLRHWRQKSELRAVREHRPHAGDADAELAHHEFAVSAEDDGWLLTWRFRPLRIDEVLDEDEIEVPGRPCYAAKVVEDRPFDAADAAVAAGQLFAAQERAAAMELDAIAAGHHGITDESARAEREIEARTTAAALRRATGQDRGRRRR